MELWTPEHAKTLLPAILIMAVFALVLRLWLGRKSLKVRMIPLQIATCLLLLLEVGKQVLSLKQGYDLYHLPFHYCSLFLFIMPFMAFYRGKYQQQVNLVGTSICAGVFMLMLIYPNLIYGAGNVQNYFGSFFDFHTVTYHNIVVLMLLLILALDLHVPGDSKQQVWIVLSMVIFSAVAATMAHILKTNYANFYSCNVPVLETVRQAVAEAIGPLVAKLVYILILVLLNILFTWGAYLLCRLCRRATKLN